jgi:hypothetical protein
VRGLAHRKNWHPARQSSQIGEFLLVVAKEVQYQLISINKLESGEEQHDSIYCKNCCIRQNENFEKSQG